MYLLFYFVYRPLLAAAFICWGASHTAGEDTIVAKVGNKYLYSSEIPKLAVGDNKSSKESQKYIYEWVRDRLIVAEAAQFNSYNKGDVIKKVENYKNGLIIYDFVNTYIKNNLNTDITKEEVISYYKRNKKNFELKENIVRCRFAIIPKSSPGGNRLTGLFYSSADAENKKLLEYCMQYAKSYFLNSGIWISFSKVIEQTPLEFRSDKVGLVKRMKKKGVTKIVGTDNIYYFQVYSYKIYSDVSPFEFVEDKIKEIIIHQRKLKLKQQLIDGIMQRAKKEGKFTIYP